MALQVIAFWALGYFDIWENKSWDLRVSLLAKPGKATDEVRLILLDQNSLDWGSKENGLSWPWPRVTYQTITNFCQRVGAKALAFDVLFTEPSLYGVQDDVDFGTTISEFGKVANSVFLAHNNGSYTTWPANLRTPKFKISGLDKWVSFTNPQGFHFPRAAMPIGEVAKNSAVLCNAHITPDPDGVYRRVKLFGIFDGNHLPILGLGAYLAKNPEALVHIEPEKMLIDGQAIPIDDNGEVILRYRGPTATHKAYSAAAVIQSEIRLAKGEKAVITDINDFKDKYVFFGFSAPGLYDLRSAPVGGIYTGVEIHATTLDNFLSGDFMRATPVWLTITVVFILSLSCAVLISFLNSATRIIAIGTLFIFIPVLISLISYFLGFWLPLVVQETTVIEIIAVILTVNYVTEGQQKRFIKNVFKHYLSPLVIEQLVQNPAQLKLGGERKVLSIFFSDIQGFTSLSEELDPESVTQFLNDYFSAMTDIIHQEGGTIDKYDGDAIIAFWNAPLAVSEHASRAVQAALRSQQRLQEMNSAFKKRVGKEILVRIGINTGHAVVGNMGSHSRFDYTIVGDAVNLAARLEGVNKHFGTHTLITESTRELVGDKFAIRELARVTVLGRNKPVTIFEPMFHEEYAARKDVYKTFVQGRDMFYKGSFDKAIKIFSMIKDVDPPSVSYIDKCGYLLKAPPPNWTGVWDITTK